jgi:POT family proton-dependent oligopeptide transporter
MKLSERTFFGHPRGLATLFFTEMWERFSYYGMRGLLVLFMVDAARGGFGMNETKAGAIYGLYTFGVYALALPGGWIADRLTGQRKAVLYGGIVIALGHYVLAIPSSATFYLGLILVAIGTGLLKPNVSAIVGDLYPDKGARRDAGFSIYYMGINIGAFLGPGVCSYLGEKVNWHLGFGAAGVGMTFAVVQYVLGTKHLLGAGELKEEFQGEAAQADARKKLRIGLAGIGGALGLLVLLSFAGALPLSIEAVAESTSYTITALAVIYFCWVIAFLCRDKLERQRVGVIALLFLGAAFFWSGFEQAGSTMNLFASEHTDRTFFGWEMPAGWLQQINPLFIILLAPVVGAVWVWLGARSPSLGAKFGYGLVLLGVGFFVLAWGSQFIDEKQVSPMWLVSAYFFHTVGELCLSPVGLSSVTKLSPPRLVGQMMGTWFMGAALGNLIAGVLTGTLETKPPSELFQLVALIAVGAGALFFVLSPWMKRLAGGIQ